MSSVETSIMLNINLAQYMFKDISLNLPACGSVGCPSGDQKVAGSILSGSGNILSWRLIMIFFFVHSFPSADSRKAIVNF